MHQKKNETLREEQVGKQINASVLMLINEVELSIYRFLASRTKKQPRSIKLGVNRLTSHWTINEW